MQGQPARAAFRFWALSAAAAAGPLGGNAHRGPQLALAGRDPLGFARGKLFDYALRDRMTDEKI